MVQCIVCGIWMTRIYVIGQDGTICFYYDYCPQCNQPRPKTLEEETVKDKGVKCGACQFKFLDGVRCVIDPAKCGSYKPKSPDKVLETIAKLILSYRFYSSLCHDEEITTETAYSLAKDILYELEGK